MKILAFSDWRVQSLEMIKKVVEDNSPDVILYAGDDVDRILEKTYIKTKRKFYEINLSSIRSEVDYDKELNLNKYFLKSDENYSQKLFGIPLYYVMGNDDRYSHVNEFCVIEKDPRFYDKDGNRLVIEEDIKGKFKFSQAPYIQNIMKEERYIQKIGSLLNPKHICKVYSIINPSIGVFKIKNNDEEINVFGFDCDNAMPSDITNSPESYSDIYLSHIPPKGKLDLSVRFGLEHIGSTKLLESIKKYQPKLVICGHSHLWGGLVAKIEDTVIINVSSQDSKSQIYKGNYAIIDTKDWSIQMKTIQDSNSKYIRGMSTVKRNVKLKKWSNKDYSGVSKNLLEEADKLDINADLVKDRMESLNWEAPKIKKKFTLNPDSTSFVDVETGRPNGEKPGKLWLVGILHEGEISQFIYPQERQNLINFIKNNNISRLTSWTTYDHKVLRPIFGELNITIKFVDACQRTSNSVVWHNYSLHDFYDSLFQNTNSPDLIPGHIAGVYADHLFFGDVTCEYCPPKDELIEKIKERNKIDLSQMKEICEFLWGRGNY